MEPVSYRKKLEGKSNAHLITFSDGKDYVVKFFQHGFEKALPNEWVAYPLARFLGLPTPFARIVDIPQNFLTEVEELAQMSDVRYQFASRYIPNCRDGHEVDITNKKVVLTNDDWQLASIILFDYWLANTDRTRKNILLKETAADSYHVTVIDHAEIFGNYFWLIDDLEKLPVDVFKSATHQFIAKFIKQEQSFFDVLEVIQQIPVLLLEEIVELIPEEWKVTREERKAIVSTLIKRRKRILPEMIEKFIGKVYRPLKKG